MVKQVDTGRSGRCKGGNRMPARKQKKLYTWRDYRHCGEIRCGAPSALACLMFVSASLIFVSGNDKHLVILSAAKDLAFELIRCFAFSSA